MSLKFSLRVSLMAAASAIIMTGCAVAPGLTDSEQEMTQTLQGSNFQPANGRICSGTYRS